MKFNWKNCKLFKLFKKPNREFLWKFFLTFVIIFFIVTYTIVNRETIVEQATILEEGGFFFAKVATYKVLHLNKTKVGLDKDTYEIELIVFKQVNDIRAGRDLKPMMWDPMLGGVARGHSLDMAQNSYFNHINQQGMDPEDRAKALGVRTVVETQDTIETGIGENIGFMPRGVVRDVGILITTEDVASGMVLEWMQSDGHRENILREDYRYTGVGVAYDGKGNYYLTQNFQ